MPLYDLTEFLKLSSALNYNLSAASLNRYNVLMFIIGNKRLHSDEKRDRDHKGIVMEALEYLFTAFGQKRRRLGPMAVLHPLRSAALLARSLEKLNLLDLLTQLFHDILEDVSSLDFHFAEWKEMESKLHSIMDRMDSKDERELTERLLALTRLKEESYYQYIGRLLARSHESPELIQVKLADRLDNTLDMRIAHQDPLEGIDFFKNIFQLMFVNTYPGEVPETNHPAPSVINGAKRLYQLFKNAVLLSLIRQKGSFPLDAASQGLFDAVCEASLKEAQRNFVHVAGYHFKGVPRQRNLLLKTMEYCYTGRSDLVTRPDRERPLDGLFSTYFGHTSSRMRNEKLDELYRDKPLMIQASIAFIVIFMSFLNDPGFYVKGISAEGIAPF